ncbi:MAG: hypothetical protein HKN94_03035 [Acidimicrobiales bacterium]|nr:hypothetical protein [Acidimicrobiales bacterium]RZV48666.1 MAG: hypothetical protein EX269_00915 [Acidimicrobiales bacterium]
MPSDVDDFFGSADGWQQEMRLLRSIVGDHELTEAFKWRQPCYTTAENKNVAIISGFKEYCALAFFKGSLLEDPDGWLEAPGENSQSSRILKFTSVGEIEARRAVIEEFIRAAIEVEAAGKTVELKATSEYEMPEELLDEFSRSSEFEAAFHALTPGRQRGFILFFGGAKQSATRVARIEKHRERIFAGKGIHDCVCGRSQRLPRCDGSHSRPA